MNQSAFFGFLNHWWNLPYMVMLGLVAVFFALQVVGILGGGGDHEADVDGDVDADLDHDVDVDHDADLATSDHDADADHDVDAGSTLGWQTALSFFGVGRVPLMVVWVTFFIFAGFTGIFVNSSIFVHHAGTFPAWGFGASAAGSIAVGLVAVRLFSRAAARFVDVGGHGSTKKHELSGKLGVVASQKLDHQFGEVRVRDARGNELLLHGRLPESEPTLSRGQKVVLVDFDHERELFWVTRSPEEEERRTS
jgi:Inner membrane protein YqiJ, N-terminal